MAYNFRGQIGLNLSACHFGPFLEENRQTENARNPAKHLTFVPTEAMNLGSVTRYQNFGIFLEMPRYLLFLLHYFNNPR